MLRRLPWVEELPRACTATMRPTPVMIPVNMPLFSQGLGRLDRSGLQFPDSKGVATRDSGQDTQVRPQQLGRLEHQG
jgi:hypothetical protein